MAKTYLVKQERKFNGETTTASFSYTCEESEISALVPLLDGKITVLVEDTTLSSAEDASTTVTGGIPIDSISMVHSEAKTKFIGAYDKPILFKITTSVVDIQNLLKTHKPFAGAYATEVPDNVYPKIGSMGNL